MIDLFRLQRRPKGWLLNVDNNKDIWLKHPGQVVKTVRMLLYDKRLGGVAMARRRKKKKK